MNQTQEEAHFDMEKVTKLLKAHSLTIISEIGQGAFSKCFRVTSEKYADQHSFVCKVTNRSDSFSVELDVLRSCNHRNIVCCYDFFHDNEYNVLVLEDCVGGSIKDCIIQNGPLVGHKLASMALQLVEALDHLHTHNIAHLDLKPANMLLDSYFRLKLGDFGISKRMKDSVLHDNFQGTVLYMAPEVIAKVPYDPFKADIWSLGLTMYYLAVGKTLANSPEEIQNYVKTGYIPLPLAFPKWARTFIYSCLRMVPEERTTLFDLRMMLKDVTYPLKQLGSIQKSPTASKLAHSGQRIVIPEKNKNKQIKLSKSQAIAHISMTKNRFNPRHLIAPSNI